MSDEKSETKSYYLPAEDIRTITDHAAQNDRSESYALHMIISEWRTMKEQPVPRKHQTQTRG